MKKIKFKKEVTWIKEPNWDGFFTGVIFLVVAFVMLCYFILMYESIIVLSIIFSLMLVYGGIKIWKHCGKGRKVYYFKLRK